LLVVAPRPHKEERFLFPIYPCLCLGAAVSSVTLVEAVLPCFLKKNQQSSPGQSALILQCILFAPAVLLSMSRTLALSNYYTAPLYVYSQLQHQPDVADSVVCTCGEWYRFPSSFYLPATIRSFGFVASSFEGQLPQPFTQAGSGPLGTNEFNNHNQPQAASYTSIDDCDYLIDLWTSDDCRENDSIWRPIAQGSFLDADRTTSTLHRILYVPYLHEQEEITRGGVQYVDYILYQKTPAEMN
jgi:alpha-1,2-mannosyltransferase